MVNIQLLGFYFLILLTPADLYSQTTVLSGKAPDYGSKEITFYTIPDPVLHQKVGLATTRLTADGMFSVTLPVSHTIEIYSDLEKYCGTMVVEPSGNYQITLPPYSLRTTNEARSPYFKPAKFWFGLTGTDKTGLNLAVRSFVTDFNIETAKNTVPIYQYKSKEVVNEIIVRLEKKYSAVPDEYFKTLKKYYFAGLEYAVYQRNPEFIIKKYFASEPIHLTNPAYQRAFETIFTDFLRKQSQAIQNRGIIYLVNSGNYIDLITFYEKKGYSKEFAGLAVLKGLNDGYYSGSFSKTGVIKAVEMAQTTTTSLVLQSLARQVKDKITQLAAGGKAPSLKLLNLKKDSVSLDQYLGKFIYLTFFRSRSADCRTELDSIVSMEKRLGRFLSVVSVSLDDDFDNAVKLWKERGYSWELLNGSKQKQLIINYNTSATPTFYLIGPLGTLMLTQTPSPSQGFEPLFNKIFQRHSAGQKKPQ
jgi:peroxiredoxin